MTSKNPCPSEQTLRDYSRGALDESMALAVMQHLAACVNCRQAVNGLQPGLEKPGAPVTVTRLPVDEQPTRGLTPEAADELSEDPLEGIRFLEPSPNPEALGRLGNYDVLGLLGQGGMGVVLKAFDTSLHRTVAIKLLSPQIATSKDSRRRFLREARAAAGINHPNVVVIHAVEEKDGMPYLVMECVAGQTLRERTKQQPSFDLASLLRIGAQIAAGLAAAHQQGVIHRDIKPTNIMLEDGIERVKITDFGLALIALDASQATTARRVLGTPAYMSPEQVRGERVGPRSDLFSLGCVLWSMVTGKSPFHGSHALDAARKVEDQAVPLLTDINPQVPPQFAQIVGRLLEKKPDNRFQSAAEVRDLLQQYLARISQGESGSLVVPPAPRKDTHRRMWPWLLAGAAAALVLAPILLLIWTALESAGPPSGGTAAKSALGTTSGPRLLRVRQTGPADSRSIGEALRRAAPGCVIRVEDEATYTEALVIDDAARLRDVAIEASAAATLAGKEGAYAAITIRGTPGVSIRGFRVHTIGNQHALIVLGKAERTMIENMHWSHAPDSGWACIYLAEGACGTPDEPITIRNCTIQAGKTGLMLGGMFDGGARHVLIENNRFQGSSTHIVLVLPAAAIRLQANSFLQGTGIDVHSSVPQADGQSLQIVNNTFFQTPTWLRAALGPGQGSMICNNLVVEADRLEAPAGSTLADVVRVWTLRNNWWEPGPAAALQEVSLVTEHHGRVELASRDPAHPNFLRPIPGSPLVSAGAGGAFPRYVGAYQPPSE